ncbi:MAG: acyl-CoA dehydrogenase family protein [Candidatus Acidiferrales bacterium]
MDFKLTEEQEQLRHAVREFTEAEIRPHVLEWDEAGRLPDDLLPKLAELGLMGAAFPEEYGGAGFGYLGYCLVIEELARVDPSVAITVAAHHGLCTSHIFLTGTEEQRRRWVVPLAQGKKLGCWGLTEAEAGSDAGGTRTQAVRDGADWVLNGSKTFITNGHFADICVAMAVTDRSLGSRGISAFVIERGTPGFYSGKKENKLGMRASDTSEVVFENCRIPAGNLLGKEGEGYKNSLRVLDTGRVGLAALALGIAQGAFEVSLAYAKERKQFGEPIAANQAIQWKLANMKMEIEAARLLVFQAAWRADQGAPDTRASSIAKLYASEMAVRATNEAVQIHGGYGFIKDYPAEKFYRDVKVCTIGEGTSEIQRLIIARSLLGKPAAPKPQGRK